MSVYCSLSRECSRSVKKKLEHCVYTFLLKSCFNCSKMQFLILKECGFVSFLQLNWFRHIWNLGFFFGTWSFGNCYSMSVCIVCVCVHCDSIPVSADRPGEGIRRLPGAGVTGGWEPPCGRWEPNTAPLQQQQLLLTAEPALQSHPVYYSSIISSRFIYFIL